MLRPSPKIGGFILKIVIFVVFLFIAFRLTNYVADNSNVQRWVGEFGYLGIFAISVISGFNLVVPIPIATFVPLFLESGFPFLPVVLVISLGMTLGDIFSYLIGLWGRRAIIKDEGLKKHWFIKLISRTREKYKVAPYIILFLFISFVPIPNEVTVMPMGFMGYRMKIILPILVVGNIIFNFWTVQAINGIFNII